MTFCQFCPPATRSALRRQLHRGFQLSLWWLVGAGVPPILCQQPTEQPLTINEAVAAALTNNSALTKATFETRRAQADLAANRTKRYASSSITGQGSELITQPHISFAAGSLGTYPGVGPIPGTNTTITIPRDFAGVLSATATQPVTTQIRLHFQIRSLEAGVAGTKQDEQKQRLQTIDDVRRAYYAVVEAQADLDSARASLPLYKESVRVAMEDRNREAVLPADLLHAKAQLVQAENTVNDDEDSILKAQEKLNDLMGRDIHHSFRVEAVCDIDDATDSEAALEARAMENRPDVKKARLDIQKADYDLRAKRAEYIPEVSGSVSYYTTFNFGSTLPSNIGLAGVSLNWEPWDWGRKHQEAIGKRLQEDEAKVSAGSTERSARMEVSTAWRQLQSARRQLALNNANVLTARENLREIQEQANRETKLPKDLFQAQSDLASAEDQRQESLTSFWKARADIKKVTGDE